MVGIRGKRGNAKNEFSPLFTANANQPNESVTCAHVAGTEVCACHRGKLVWWAALPGRFGTSLVPRDQTGRAQMQIVILVPRLNNLGTRPQLFCVVARAVYANEKHRYGLDYDRTVMLTCKLLFAAAKSAPALMSYVCWAFFFFTTKGGGG